jgi:uncharacterized phiE125 gp8 family phage protein
MLQRIKNPEYPVVNLAMMKAHLCLNHGEEDTYLIHLCQVATEAVEHYIGASLLQQTWQLMWHKRQEHQQEIVEEVSQIILPYPPLIEIQSIEAILPKMVRKSIRQFYISHRGQRPYLTLRSDAPVIQVQYTAGMAFKPPELPSQLIQAVLCLIAHLYESRQSVDISQNPTLTHLLQPFYMRGIA